MMYKCRACLIKCEEDQISCMDLNDKLPAISTNISIADALREIACVCIAGDNYYQPTKICSSCCYRLQDAYIFIKRVQESAAIIQQCSSIGLPPSLTYTVPLIGSNTTADSVNTSREWDNEGQENQDSDNEITKDCLEDVRIANIQSCTDLAIEFQAAEEIPNDNEILTEADIKKEPELLIEENICEDQISQYMQHNSEDNLQHSNYKVDKMCQTNGHVNIDHVNDAAAKCVCRSFHRVDYISDEIKQSIRRRFINMSEEAKSTYIRSMLHACKCGRNKAKQITKDVYNTSDTLETNHRTTRTDDIVIIYTLERNGEYVSVNRQTFIEVFGLVGKMPPSLNKSKYNLNYDEDVEVKLEQPSMEMDNESLPSDELSDSEKRKQVNSVEPQIQQCMLCCKLYKNVASLRRHVIVNHSYTTNNDKETDADIGNNTEDANDNNLLQEIKKMKMKRNTKNNSLPCCFCFKKFINMAGLKSHKKFCNRRNKNNIELPVVS